MNNELKIFVPTHITGFFEIINNKNLSLKGSRGAGITLNDGVITNTKVLKGTGNLYITVNNKKDKLNTISKICVSIISKRYNVNLSEYDIYINHTLKLPIGAGFGTSASFALGISYTLPHLLGINISYNEAGEIAHLSELSQSSGLGDVISEIYGGCVIRLREGSPINGKINKILVTEPIYVITKPVSVLSTSGIINNPKHKNIINKQGNYLLNELLNNPTLEQFIKLSWKFAKNTKLVNPEIQEIVEILNEETLGASMAMLGNTAFAISHSPDTSIKNCNISKINSTGIKFL